MWTTAVTVKDWHVSAQPPRIESAPLSPPDGRRRTLALVTGIVLPPAAALVLVPWRDTFANSAAALLLVGVVVAVAAFGDRRAGWIASVASCVSFDFFLTRPYERLSISSAHDVETTLALLVIGTAVTEIAVRSHRHFAVAMAEGNYLALIHDLSDLVARGALSDTVVAVAREDLTELFGLSACRFEAPGPTVARAQLRRNGEVELGDRRFDVRRHGLPEGEIELAVQNQDHTYGLFVLEPGVRSGVSIEQRVVALALADQVGAALAASSRAA